MNFPPYISRTPPPLNETEEDEDDEFGTFAFSSDLGEEVCDDFGKNSQVIKSEDNVSEDSGFCMNSVGQTQSPSDISPLSCSVNKANDCIAVDNQDLDLNGSLTSKTEDIKSNDSFNNGTLLKDSEELGVKDVYLDSSEASKAPKHNNSYLSKKIFVNSHDLNMVNCVGDNTSSDFVNDTLTDGVTLEVGCVNDTVTGDLAISNTFTDEITSKINCVDKKACKDFVINTQLTDELTLEEVGSCSQVLGERNNPEHHENIEINWFESPEPSDVDTFTTTEPAFSIKDSSNEEILGLQKDNFLHSNDHFTPLQDLVISDSTSEKHPIDSEPINREIEDWDSNDDEFSEFTSFQVVESFGQLQNKEKDQLEQNIEIHGLNSDCFIGTLHLALENSIVWTNLQCFEGTSAFKYQWSTSSSQMKFMQALQIDSRNILYGPWNRMNKFHMADVSSSFESNNCSKGCSYSSVTTKKKEIIPDPYFDWTSSGLVNPLQGASNEKETMRHKSEEKVVSEIITTKSREVLNSVPKLSFLKSTFINFK